MSRKKLGWSARMWLPVDHAARCYPNLESLGGTCRRCRTLTILAGRGSNSACVLAGREGDDTRDTTGRVGEESLGWLGLAADAMTRKGRWSLDPGAVGPVAGGRKERGRVGWVLLRRRRGLDAKHERRACSVRGVVCKPREGRSRGTFQPNRKSTNRDGRSRKCKYVRDSQSPTSTRRVRQRIFFLRNIVCYRTLYGFMENVPARYIFL
jgi:hypothetical protein